ncbi:MAG: transcriptional regulator with XRE-family HTH domain [Gammaproteobacteria bacterium]|jgi:transcriptional regulator with XRE-family HTH domain
MSSLYEQLKQRRKALGLRQKDMLLRVGMSRQQYQRLEAGGNSRIDTLELVAKGLDMTLMLIPQEKLRAVRLILDSEESSESGGKDEAKPTPLTDDPWQGMLEK